MLRGTTQDEDNGFKRSLFAGVFDLHTRTSRENKYRKSFCGHENKKMRFSEIPQRKNRQYCKIIFLFTFSVVKKIFLGPSK